MKVSNERVVTITLVDREVEKFLCLLRDIETSTVEGVVEFADVLYNEIMNAPTA